MCRHKPQQALNRIFTAVLSALLFVSLSAQAQMPVASDTISVAEAPAAVSVPSPGLWAQLRRALLPEPLGIMYELRAYITDLTLTEPRSRKRDLRLTDEIFDYAVYLAEGDVKLALLALTWATLPYFRFPAKIPLLGLTLTIPVSTENESDYERRLSNLPGMLLPDTPPSLDRDKLPHFFGSAFLQCVTKEPSLAEAAGVGVEILEKVFKLEGFCDERDILVNSMGVFFAMQLQKQRNVRPSDIFFNWPKDYESSTHSDR